MKALGIIASKEWESEVEKSTTEDACLSSLL